MASNKTQQSDPTRHLPKPMRQYLGLPVKLFVVWVLLSGLAVGLFYSGKLPQGKSPAEPPSPISTNQTLPVAPTPVSPAQNLQPKNMPAVNINVSGPKSFSLQNQGNKVLIAITGEKPLELVNTDDGKQVQTQTGAVLFRLKSREDGQAKIYDESNAYRYRMKSETEEGEDTCKLYDGQDTLLNRVKVKAESFNVYAASSQRIYKGKMKNGSYVLKNESGDSIGTLQGVSGLKDAALLSFPVEIPLRVLLWASH